jgi:hypothetical protein
MGVTTKPALKLRFDRRVRLKFQGATITSDAGLLAALWTRWKVIVKEFMPIRI